MCVAFATYATENGTKKGKTIKNEKCKKISQHIEKCSVFNELTDSFY